MGLIPSKRRDGANNNSAHHHNVVDGGGGPRPRSNSQHSGGHHSHHHHHHGHHSHRQLTPEEAKLLTPNGLYPSCDWDSKAVKRLILEKKIAPFYPGKEEKTSPDQDECPICFLYYAGGLNRTRCCKKELCTECFLQIKKPNTPPLQAFCPFCNRNKFSITFSGPKTREEREAEEQEEKKVLELQQRMREEEIERDRQREENKRKQQQLLTEQKGKEKNGIAASTENSGVSGSITITVGEDISSVTITEEGGATADENEGNNNQQKKKKRKSPRRKDGSLSSSKEDLRTSAQRHKKISGREQRTLSMQEGNINTVITSTSSPSASTYPPAEASSTGSSPEKDLEELMLMEAIRLSLLESNDRGGNKREQNEQPQENKSGVNATSLPSTSPSRRIFIFDSSSSEEEEEAEKRVGEKKSAAVNKKNKLKQQLKQQQRKSSSASASTSPGMIDEEEEKGKEKEEEEEETRTSRPHSSSSLRLLDALAPQQLEDEEGEQGHNDEDDAVGELTILPSRRSSSSTPSRPTHRKRTLSAKEAPEMPAALVDLQHTPLGEAGDGSNETDEDEEAEEEEEKRKKTVHQQRQRRKSEKLKGKERTLV